MTPPLAKAARIMAVLALGLAAPGCRSIGPDRTPSPPAGGEEVQSPVLAVTVAKVATAPMQSELRLLGTTAATHHVILRAPVAGRVTGMKLKVGDVVRRGEVVAHVMSREIEAAQQGLAVARKMDPEDAKSLARSVDRYTRAAGLPVKAPDSGVVAAPPVTSGQMVNYLDPLVDLIDPASVYVDAAVPMEELHRVRPGMKAIITSPLRPGAELPARVAALLPSFNSASATEPVRIEFAGPEHIAETGAPVEVRVVTAQASDATVVPALALFQDTAGGFYMFVLGSDSRAHRIVVVPGIRSSDQVQIVLGVHPGQTVITSGGYALSDGLRVTAAEGEP